MKRDRIIKYCKNESGVKVHLAFFNKKKERRTMNYEPERIYSRRKRYAVCATDNHSDNTDKV